jgi:hypothetical protein
MKINERSGNVPLIANTEPLADARNMHPKLHYAFRQLTSSCLSSIGRPVRGERSHEFPAHQQKRGSLLQQGAAYVFPRPCPFIPSRDTEIENVNSLGPRDGGTPEQRRDGSPTTLGSPERTPRRPRSPQKPRHGRGRSGQGDASEVEATNSPQPTDGQRLERPAWFFVFFHSLLDDWKTTLRAAFLASIPVLSVTVIMIVALSSDNPVIISALALVALRFFGTRRRR